MFNGSKRGIVHKELPNSSNIIGKGTKLKGDLNTLGNLRVEGSVGGSIQTKAKVVLGETAVVEGSIAAQTAEIGGEVQGTIKVLGLLILKPTAVVNGDIVTSKLVLEVGARFNGKCNMGNSLKENELQPPKPHKKNDSPIAPILQPVALFPKAPKG